MLPISQDINTRFSNALIKKGYSKAGTVSIQEMATLLFGFLFQIQPSPDKWTKPGAVYQQIEV